jgi:hypothetical protein
MKELFGTCYTAYTVAMGVKCQACRRCLIQGFATINLKLPGLLSGVVLRSISVGRLTEPRF